MLLSPEESQDETDQPNPSSSAVYTQEVGGTAGTQEVDRSHATQKVDQRTCTQGSDKGVCNHENKDRTITQESTDLIGSGPLRAPHGSSTDIHTMISETIHRQNLSETQRSLSDSTLAVSSNQTAECLGAAAAADKDNVHDRGTPDGAAASSSTPVMASTANSYSKNDECWDYTGGGDAAEDERDQPEEKYYFKATEGLEPGTGHRSECYAVYNVSN